MRHIILLGFTVFVFSACQKTPEVQTITGYAQGTTYSVKFWTDHNTTIDNETLKQNIDTELARIDRLMSNYRDDSDIARFNQQKIANTPILLDKEILSVLSISAEVHKQSSGCYDPTIGPLFRVWGFKKDHLRIPSQTQIDEKLSAIGFAQKITFAEDALIKAHPETTVDLSAIGQGYAIAKISDLLNRHHINNYLAEIGGEMLVSGQKPQQKSWQVGVERPVPNSQKISEIITLTGKQKTAIMTSGTYRHYFDDNGKRYSHILDPRTGKPVEHDSVAVTVLVNDATYADAWSTALLCLGSEQGLAIANSNDIPAIFYDIKNNRLIRQESNPVQAQAANWRIQQQ